MADLSAAGATRCPAAARQILIALKRGAVRLRTRHDVVPVGRVAHSVDRIKAFGDSCLLGDQRLTAVKLCKVYRDESALGVVPRTLADPVPRIHGWLSRCRHGTEIGAPRV